MFDLEYKDQLVELLNDDENLFQGQNFVLFYTKTIIFEKDKVIFHYILHVFFLKYKHK
jgi:hypothetical protein